jgi:2',3'-cyclic-nucleotide 2'-phosphodiesterase / 3'-nucleotidase
VVLDAPEENREALVEYLADASKTSGGKVNPSADNNWRILPVPGITLTFISSSAATKFLPAHKNIKLLKDNGDGFSTFALMP